MTKAKKAAGRSSFRRSGSKGRLSLGRRLDVYLILMRAFDMYVDSIDRIASESPEGELEPEKMAAADVTLADFLDSIFRGMRPEVAVPVPGWNGEGLGRRLRVEFAMKLLTLDARDAELFEDDENIVYFGMIEFVSEVQGVFFDCLEQGSQSLESQGRRVHEICARWSALLSNSSEPLPDAAASAAVF